VIDARLFSHQAAQVTNQRLIDKESLSPIVFRGLFFSPNADHH
jgi:hypothetical protein